MAVRELIEIEDRHEIGTVMFSFIEEMYPICRSITGDGVRKTLDILKKIIPLEVIEIGTGRKFLTGQFLMSGTLMMHM